MGTVFCCSSAAPYRPRILDHEDKFQAFLRWIPSAKPSINEPGAIVDHALYAVQVVKQVNYGPQESIRYFIATTDDARFVETSEDALISANFEKLNSYKNFRCNVHNKFFELNLYQTNPLNTHHWRSTLARPSRVIDLSFRQQQTAGGTSKKMKENEADQNKDDSFLELQQSFLSALKVANPKIERSIVVSNFSEQEGETQQPKADGTVTLKDALRLLLPTVSQGLGSSRLTSLLCLDWISTALGLGLQIEDMWTSEIDSSNIIIFITDCLAADDAFETLTVELADIEHLVVPAICYVDSCNGNQVAGKLRLQKIIERVLESGSGLDWVTACEGGISRVFTSGPSQKLLQHCQQHCQHKNLGEDRRLDINEEVRERNLEDKSFETIVPWRFQNAGYDDFDDYHGGDEYDIDNDSDFWRRAAD